MDKNKQNYNSATYEYIESYQKGFLLTLKNGIWKIFDIRRTRLTKETFKSKEESIEWFSR